MVNLVRTTLTLEQFECEKCGKMVYINADDIQEMREKKGKIIIPDCPFDCWSETIHKRSITVKVQSVLNHEPKPCAQCGEHFIPDSENVMMCEECFPKIKIVE